MITTRSLLNISIKKYFLVMRTSKLYSEQLSNIHYGVIVYVIM